MLVDTQFDFYIPASQRQMVKTVEHKARLHWDCPDIAQLNPPGTWVFLYFVNHITWKPQLELASAVGHKEADGELLPLLNNTVLVLEKGCAPIFRLFLTTGTCSGHTFQTCVCFQTSWTSQTCFRLSCL
jgi:hypothetical protein